MVSESLLNLMTQQLIDADKLIEEQKDNLAFLEEIGENIAEERAALNAAMVKRDRIFTALAKRMPSLRKKKV